MTIALSLLNTKMHNSGNISCLYLATLSGTYPSGGYTINASVMPSAIAKFKSIKRANFDRDGAIDSNGNIAKISSIDNSDSTNPEMRLKLYEFPTGGGDLQEMGNGTAHAATIHLCIEGVPLKGVDGDVW